MNSKAQLNTRIPEEAHTLIVKASAATGIKIEDLVLDGLKLLTGETDEMTELRADMVRRVIRQEGLHLLHQ